ncbi:hypothetical protein ACH121_18195 [Streptomyces sp. NB004]
MDLSDRATRMRVNKRFREKGIPAKVCGKCFVVKGHEAFHIHRQTPDGRNAYCQPCTRAKAAAWYRTNTDRALEASRQRYETDRDRIKERERRRRVEQRATEGREGRARTLGWRLANRMFRESGVPVKICGGCRVGKWHGDFSADQTKADGQSYRCKECAGSAGRDWYDANRDRHAVNGRRWQAANREKVRASNQARRARAALVPTEPFTAADLRHDWEDHDLYSCFYCGGSLADGYDVEHYYPKFPDDEETTPAGPHAVWNLVPSCVPCNRGVDGKHSREPWQFLRESLADQGTDLDACLAILDGRR